jgi:hypothetical protein
MDVLLARSEVKNSMDSKTEGQAQQGARPKTIIELRRYRLYPEKREEMISLFDRELVEPQDEAGMYVVGQFRDIDHPDAFVWLRAFEDMEARAAALEAFYSGPVWQRRGPDANATMRNSDNVLLLEARETESVISSVRTRPGPGTEVVFGSVFLCNICYLKPSGEKAFGEFFQQKIKPEIHKAGADIVGVLTSAHKTNNWPRLPVREGENVFVWLSRFSHIGDYSIYAGRLERSDRWRIIVTPELDAFLWKPMEISRLTPTARSGLR